MQNNIFIISNNSVLPPEMQTLLNRGFPSRLKSQPNYIYLRKPAPRGRTALKLRIHFVDESLKAKPETRRVFRIIAVKYNNEHSLYSYENYKS